MSAYASRDSTLKNYDIFISSISQFYIEGKNIFNALRDQYIFTGGFSREREQFKDFSNFQRIFQIFKRNTLKSTSSDFSDLIFFLFL